MNGYIAFYRGKQIEVYANTTYEAQSKAAAVFKARKSHTYGVKHVNACVDQLKAEKV